jgi:hypothetical protein
MLKIGHLRNCFNHYNSRKTFLPDGIYLGYMEACLVQFGVIESKSNGLSDYVKKTKKKFLFWEYEVEEDRVAVVTRLTKEFLNKNCDDNKLSNVSDSFIHMIYGAANHNSLEDFKEYFRQEIKNIL